jgi:hypothetical protein
MSHVPLIFLIGVIYFCPDLTLIFMGVCWRLLASARASLGMVDDESQCHLVETLAGTVTSGHSNPTVFSSCVYCLGKREDDWPALTSRTDICFSNSHVCFGPQADMSHDSLRTTFGMPTGCC